MKVVVLIAIMSVKFVSAQCIGLGTREINCPAGSANVEAAIQGAPDRSIIRLQAGTFNIPDGISMNVGNVKVIGAGKRQTIINMTSHTGNEHGITLAASSIELSNFSLIRSYRNHSQDGSGIVSLQPIQKIENVLVEGFAWGIYARDVNYAIEIRDCSIQANGNGIGFDNGHNCNVTISGSDIFGNNGYGIQVFGTNFLGANFRMERNNISANGRSGIRIESGVGIAINNNFIESNEWRIDAGNENQSADAQIEFCETNSGANSQINHISMTDNFFGLFHHGDSSSIGTVTPTATKRLNPATFKDVKPWRFVGTPLYNSSLQAGTNVRSQGNYYLPYNWPTLPSGATTWDRNFCNNLTTCF